MKYSKRLEVILKTRTDAAFEFASSTCTAGYDNDGSTGREIFENGYNLGILAAKKELEVFWAEVSNQGVSDVCFFIMAASEDEACEKAASWDLNEVSDDE